METSTVRERLLEHAQTLIQQRGYHGFSYRDLSTLVGVKTSSIHYYFPAKDDLVLEAVQNYSTAVLTEMREIPETFPAPKKLERYSKLFGKALGEGDRICLCGMLAADIQSLPDPVRNAIQGYFRANEAWLTEVLTQGVEEGSLNVPGEPAVAARAMFAAYQGSVIASRLFNTKVRLNEVGNWLKPRG